MNILMLVTPNTDTIYSDNKTRMSSKTTIENHDTMLYL